MEVKIMSIAEKNAENVKRGYAAFNTGDIKTLSEIFHPDSAWHTPGRSPVAGNREGQGATFAHFGRYASETGGTFKALLKNVAICEDGTIVGIHRNTAMRNGKKLDVDCCIVFEFKDGLMIDGSEYFFDLHAWDAFWS